MESNGSTSMASVCAGVLALHGRRRADQQERSPASPSVSSPNSARDSQLDRYTLLTDIIGCEDHFGDMDFKLCGTREGVTGFQLDLKLPGIASSSWTRRSIAPATPASKSSR